MRIIHREDQEQREHVELSCDAAFADESDGRDQIGRASCRERV